MNANSTTRINASTIEKTFSTRIEALEEAELMTSRGFEVSEVQPSLDEFVITITLTNDVVSA